MVVAVVGGCFFCHAHKGRWRLGSTGVVGLFSNVPGGFVGGGEEFWL